MGVEHQNVSGNLVYIDNQLVFQIRIDCEVTKGCESLIARTGYCLSLSHETPTKHDSSYAEGKG